MTLPPTGIQTLDAKVAEDLYRRNQIKQLEERVEDLTVKLALINGALHDLISEAIKKGEASSLLVHPNSTIRNTTKSYLRPD